MNTALFLRRFERAFPLRRRTRPNPLLRYGFLRRLVDPCPTVLGMTAPKNQKLLRLAFSCLGTEEAYLEVGTYQGKTLISALLGNPHRPAYACDNFSEFAGPDSRAILNRNLARSGLAGRATFLDADFRSVLRPDVIPHRVGLYLYDGAHDEPSQYDGIALAEPLLADEALVLVDDWRQAPDSGSHAQAGTRRAIAASRHEWQVCYELPARWNGDLEMWWNGMAVLRFRRTKGGRVKTREDGIHAPPDTRRPNAEATLRVRLTLLSSLVLNRF